MGFVKAIAPDILQIYEWRLRFGNPGDKMMQLAKYNQKTRVAPFA